MRSNRRYRNNSRREYNSIGRLFKPVSYTHLSEEIHEENQQIPEEELLPELSVKEPLNDEEYENDKTSATADEPFAESEQTAPTDEFLIEPKQITESTGESLTAVSYTHLDVYKRQLL